MGERPSTRSLSRLQLPSHNNGGIGRGSRSPSPATVGGNNVFFAAPSAANSSRETFEDALPDQRVAMGDIDVAELQRIAKTAADAAAAAAAALTAMTTQLRDTQQDNQRLRAIKKPDLPNFDSKNIEIWLKRVESAFTRSGVDTTKDKFAFLESKLSVDLDARINAFLYGPVDGNTWTQFKAYLTKRYGRTKQQRVQTLIDGIQREGRRPSEVSALLCELTKDVSIEDIRKEQLLKTLPVDVRRALAKESDSLTLEELGEAADQYFDAQGRPKFTSPTSTINAINNDVNPSGIFPETSAVDILDEAPVNAVRRPSSMASSGLPPRPPARSSDSASNKANQRPTKQQLDAAGLCWYHNKFGVKADKCVEGCKHPAATSSGNSQGGRRR